MILNFELFNTQRFTYRLKQPIQLPKYAPIQLVSVMLQTRRFSQRLNRTVQLSKKRPISLIIATRSTGFPTYVTKILYMGNLKWLRTHNRGPNNTGEPAIKVETTPTIGRAINFLYMLNVHPCIWRFGARIRSTVAIARNL